MATARGGMRGHGGFGACSMVGCGTEGPSWRDVCAAQGTAQSVHEKHLAGASTSLSTTQAQEPTPGQALPGWAERWRIPHGCAGSWTASITRAAGAQPN